jgi:hypothetical protein
MSETDYSDYSQWVVTEIVHVEHSIVWTSWFVLCTGYYWADKIRKNKWMEHGTDGRNEN